MTRREELIFLLDSIKRGAIDLEFFCREFFRVYFYVEKDSDKPTQNEDKFMKELAMMCGKYVNDIDNPYAFYSEKDMMTKIGCWKKVISDKK